eukprot:00547.XXX_2675_2146_1 [CDS] Oithona nana genome sequencing.
MVSERYELKSVHHSCSKNFRSEPTLNTNPNPLRTNETAIVLDPNHQEDNPDHQASGRSTIITQLIKLNDSDSCDLLTNFIFVLLLLLLLGCLALIIAMCVDSKVIGVEIHEYQHIRNEFALSHMKP